MQQWHTLSDPAAEEAVRDRLSFRLFARRTILNIVKGG
jgi:IS5 family transposase